MARTKRITKIAERVGRAPGTVEGHQRRGMWPTGSADFDRHYQVMDACGFTSGKDDWLVAVQAAALYDWPVVRLREVLIERCPGDATSAAEPGGLLQLVANVMSLIAGQSEALAPYRDGGPMDITGRLDRESRVFARRESVDELARQMGADAIRATGKVMVSEPTTPEDFEAFAEIVDASTSTIIEGTAPSNDPDILSSAEDPSSVEDPLSVPVHGAVVDQVARISSWRPWLQDAPAKELASAVKMAMHVVDLLRASNPSAALTETQRWQYVAMFAPFCGVERGSIAPVLDGMVEAAQRGTATSIGSETEPGSSHPRSNRTKEAP